MISLSLSHQQKAYRITTERAPWRITGKTGAGPRVGIGHRQRILVAPYERAAHLHPGAARAVAGDPVCAGDVPSAPYPSRLFDVWTVLIRLAPKATRCSIGSCFLCIKFGIGRRGDIASNAKQGAERVEWVEAAVEAERKFVEIGLQVLRADAVVNAT